MKTNIFVTTFLLLCATPALSMNNYDDPRKLLSYMDQALTPELDILQVTTKISSEDHLIFLVKMRGKSLHALQDEYVLLHTTHGAVYALLIPVNKNSKAPAIMLKQASHPEKNGQTELAKEFRIQATPKTFHAKRIRHGIIFSLPIDWVDFSNTLGYDAYTVKARLTGDSVYIQKIYD